MLTGSYRSAVQGVLIPLSWAFPTLPAYREGLRCRVSPMEQGKPVFLLFRGKGTVRRPDGSAGNRGRRKRMPLCNRVDTGLSRKKKLAT